MGYISSCQANAEFKTQYRWLTSSRMRIHGIQCKLYTVEPNRLFEIANLLIRILEYAYRLSIGEESVDSQARTKSSILLPKAISCWTISSGYLVDIHPKFGLSNTHCPRGSWINSSLKRSTSRLT